MGSEDGVVSFLDLEDAVLAVLGLGLNGEVVVLGEVSALDVETVEPVVVSDVLLPGLGHLGLLHLLLVLSVAPLHLLVVDVPVVIHCVVDLNLFETHLAK